MTNSSHDGLAQQRVKIIPSLVIGAGGTGVDTVRYLKRRIRLDWPRTIAGEMPDLTQFYAIDTVSYANRPDQEFLSPSEYGFMGGFDPADLIAGHEAIREWWKFDPQMLPPGLVHLGARQIRPLGRMAFFSAFPEVWSTIKTKLKQLNSIAASTQATRYGYGIPVETSGRQVFLVASICGGTGAGCILDLAARIRAQETTGVKIIAILVLPSVFENSLPGERQRQRVRANAYATLKEIDAFWHGANPFTARYSGEFDPIQLHHALFDEIYLIGHGRRGRSLSRLEDVKQQIAHFIYLTTFNNLADPVDERRVNFDRTRQFYSSFAVGAIALPHAKLSQALLAHLKRDCLLNLASDNRHKDEEADLLSTIELYLKQLTDRARSDIQQMMPGNAAEFNIRAQAYRRTVKLELLRWLVGTVIPKYGLRAVAEVRAECDAEYQDLQGRIVQGEDDLKAAERDLSWVTAIERRGGVFFRWLLSRKQSAEYYRQAIAHHKTEIATLRMLIPDANDANSGDRLLSYIVQTLDQFSRAVALFLADAEQLVNQLNYEQPIALAQPPAHENAHRNGHTGHYYEMEIDPTVIENGAAFARLWDNQVAYDRLRASVAAAQILKAGQIRDRPELVLPSRALQMLGLPDSAEVAEFIDATDRLNLDDLSAQRRDALLESLVASAVDPLMRRTASLSNFLRAPLDQLVKHLMNSVQPFWSAWPFPDEQQMEKIHMLCLADDPAASETTRQLFAEYQPPYQFVRGNNPYRLDALCIEHAVELKHISEIVACKAAYKAFRHQNKHESLHLQPNFSNLVDPT
jgi:hypothetical protein